MRPTAAVIAPTAAMVMRMPTANTVATPKARAVVVRPWPMINPTISGMLDRWQGLRTMLRTPHTFHDPVHDQGGRRHHAKRHDAPQISNLLDLEVEAQRGGSHVGCRRQLVALGTARAQDLQRLHGSFSCLDWTRRATADGLQIPAPRLVAYPADREHHGHFHQHPNDGSQRRTGTWAGHAAPSSRATWSPNPVAS